MAKSSTSRKEVGCILNSVVTSRACSSRSLKEWHDILGHCNTKDILKLEEDSVSGMKINNVKEFECGVCIQGKMTQYKNREADKRATKPLGLVHTDLAGPIDPESKEGFRFVLSFVDDYSGHITLYLLKNKSDTLRATEKYLAVSHGSIRHGQNFEK